MSSAGVTVIGEEGTGDEGMAIPMVMVMDAEADSDIAAIMGILDAINEGESGIVEVGRTSAPIIMVDMLAMIDLVDNENPVGGIAAGFERDIEPLISESRESTICCVIEVLLQSLMLPISMLSPIASQPKEVLPRVSMGQSTRPIPLNKTLFAQRGRIESCVATIRKAISSLVRRNQSFTINRLEVRSARCMASRSSDLLLMRAYGLSTVPLGWIRIGPRTPSW